MKINAFLILLSIYISGCTGDSLDSEYTTTDVLVIGGSASGTMAGIQAARMGVRVIIVRDTPWLGGMLTSAGVSAIDGNYKLHSGLWEEFRQKLYNHYGGPDNVKTGWVSNVLFEPHVGAQILDRMTQDEKNLTVYKESFLNQIEKVDDGWYVTFSRAELKMNIQAAIIIDATELGDVAKRAGIGYDIGMDSKYDFGEEIAPEKENDIIQDLTYVAILKDYGQDQDMTIDQPEGYDATKFYCNCTGRCNEDSLGRKLWDCNVMMNYGKLPNNYYMINWPLNGNDYYLNLIESTPEERNKELLKAKNHTMSYLYYLQTELGFNNLSIADDVYPTEDGLPFIPYYRESRRIDGVIRFTLNDLARPFEQENPLYRTGVAVGDYPVDHHHYAYPRYQELPDLHFYPVPSYSLPLGTLIPKDIENFIVAEKSISVTNLVNGTTRLQPVCMLIGHAAGTLAALSVKNNTSPKNIKIRQVQMELLETGAYIMPYSDIDVNRSSFKSLQRIGAAGMLKGEGKTVGWANHTLIHPDSILTYETLTVGLDEWIDQSNVKSLSDPVTMQVLLETIKKLGEKFNQDCGNKSIEELWEESKEILATYELMTLKMNDTMSREVYAVLIDGLFDPFSIRPVDHFGNYID
ncbi:FAD-dependent oxidoreductase [Bacteroidota bacterium]